MLLPIPIALVLLLTISSQTSPVQSRSYFRGIHSDEMDTASSSDEIHTGNNKTSSAASYIRNYPYGQQRSHPTNYALLGIGQNGRLFRIPDAQANVFSTTIVRKRQSESSSSSSSTSTPRCGLVPHFDSDLVNFNNSFVSNGQIPWQAAIFTTDGQFLCSAVLVSSKHVLTAAICLLTVEYDKSPHLLDVRLGAWDLRGMVSSSEEHKYYLSTSASRIHMYPEMNIADTPDVVSSSKIALLELKETVDLIKHSNIRPICLESLPMTLQRKRQSDSTTESFLPHMNISDDRKQDGHGKRNKKDFNNTKKKSHQINGKKMAHRLTSSKALLKDQNVNDLMECYVSGWGSQNQPSVTFLTKQMQTRDIEERASVSSLTVPIIPGGKYVVHGDSSLFYSDSESSTEKTTWVFQPTRNDMTITKQQEAHVNVSSSEYDLMALLHNILTTSKTSPSISPNLDPIEDYLDSLEVNPPKNIDTLKGSQSKSRKKQLNPEKEFRESSHETLATFVPIDSDELIVDKQEANEGDNHRPSSVIHNLRLRWALVTMHNISKTDNVDLSLGTAYLKSARSKYPDALCMIDIGSPVICRKRSGLIHPHSSNVQKILAGIVTWKMPCFGAGGSTATDDVALGMNELVTNYKLTQVTPINEVLDFIKQHVKESEASAPAAPVSSSTTEAASAIVSSNSNPT